jgi:hypothetical protein
MMKPSLNSRAGVAASLLVVSFLSVSVPAHAQQGGGSKTPLAQEMGGISKDARSLRKMVADPAQKDAALALIKDMEAHATKAKGFDPAKTKTVPAADKDKFVSDYKAAIDGLIGDMQKLEDAVKNGKTADASAMLDKIQQGDKRDGHKKFNSEN